MNYVIKNHENCIGCSEDGFLIRGFKKDAATEELSTEFVMDGRTQGWVGLPHGGFGMGALAELFSGLDNYPVNIDEIFPEKIDYYLGGAKVKIGDAVLLKVTPEQSGASGTISISGMEHPYISAKIQYKSNEQYKPEFFKEQLISQCITSNSENITLPRYKDCLVCGYERKYPGLNREFKLLNTNKEKIVYSQIGFDFPENDNFFYFRKGDFVHPVAPLSLLDEIMGWGGFFISARGGVSVTLSYTFYRDIRIGEKIIALGRGDEVIGKNKKLMFYTGSGGIFSVKDDGSFEPVITSSAKFLALPELTQQLKEYLVPKEATELIFEIAENQ